MGDIKTRSQSEVRLALWAPSSALIVDDLPTLGSPRTPTTITCPPCPLGGRPAPGLSLACLPLSSSSCSMSLPPSLLPPLLPSSETSVLTGHPAAAFRVREGGTPLSFLHRCASLTVQLLLSRCPSFACSLLALCRLLPGLVAFQVPHVSITVIQPHPLPVLLLVIDCTPSFLHTL